MAITKQQGKKSSSSDQARRATAAPGPHGPAANPTRGRHEQAGVDLDLDEREKARMTAKPRSARATLKGPNDRKASTSRRSGKGK